MEANWLFVCFEQDRSETVVRLELFRNGQRYDGIGIFPQSTDVLRLAVHLRHDRCRPLPHHLRLGRGIGGQETPDRGRLPLLDRVQHGFGHFGYRGLFRPRLEDAAAGHQLAHVPTGAPLLAAARIDAVAGHQETFRRGASTHRTGG